MIQKLQGYPTKIPIAASFLLKGNCYQLLRNRLLLATSLQHQAYTKDTQSSKLHLQTGTVSQTQVNGSINAARIQRSHYLVKPRKIWSQYCKAHSHCWDSKSLGHPSAVLFHHRVHSNFGCWLESQMSSSKVQTPWVFHECLDIGTKLER